MRIWASLALLTLLLHGCTAEDPSPREDAVPERLAEAVDRHVAKGQGGRTALIWLGKDGGLRAFSYGGLAASSNRFANVLKGLGLGRGDAVFGLMGRRPELYMAALGVWKSKSISTKLRLSDPSITVPNGYVHGLPVGILFFGRAWSEATLIRIAYAAAAAGHSVLVLEKNFDVGGRAILSGGNLQLGCGHRLQQEAGVKDSPDQFFLDWTGSEGQFPVDPERWGTEGHPLAKHSDREIVRAFADNAVATFDFLSENGVEWLRLGGIRGPGDPNVPRQAIVKAWPDTSEHIIPPRPGAIC